MNRHRTAHGEPRGGIALACAALSALFGCTTVADEGKIVATINLGPGFSQSAITGLVLILDAPGDAGLNLTAEGAKEQTKRGHTYTSEVKDCDGDGRAEFCVTFAENPFSGGTYTFTFSGKWPESALLSLRVVVQMQNSKEERATKEAFDDGTSLRFVARQSKTVTLSVACRVGSSCTGSDTAPTLAATEPASPSNSTSPKVKGTANAAWTVRIYGDAACAGSVLGQGMGADLAGTGIAVTVSANKTTTLFARATDSSSNTSLCVGPLSFTHDNVAPATPGSLVVAPSSPANNNTPTVRGTADVGTTVRLFAVAGCDAGSVATGSGEVFSDAGILVAVNDNTTTTFSTNAADPAGNVSGCSSSATFVEDSTIPGAPVGTGVTPQGPANNAAPLVSGVAEATTTIRIYAGDATCSATPTIGAVNGAGQFAVTVAVPYNSSTVFFGRVVDLAGNVGLCTRLNGETPYIEDSTAPAAPGAPDLANASDTGGSSSDNVTNDSTPTFTGVVEGFAMVSLYHDGGALVGTASTSASGAYTVTSSALADGVYAFTVKATDDAGNVSEPSTSLVVTIDTTAPAASTWLPDLAAASDTGASSSDNTTSVTTPTFSGSGVEANATVKLYHSGTTHVGTTTASDAGAYTVTSSALTDGVYAFAVKATDIAGNEGDASPSLFVTIDTVIATPGAPDLDPASDTGTSSTDNITGDTTPTFIGTVESYATVNLYVDGGTLVGTATANATGAYAVTSSALAEGAYAFYVKATDVAGNASGASTALDVVIDSAADCPPPGTSTRFVPNAEVNAIARIGCALYLGGSFTAIGPNTGGGAPLHGSTGALAVLAPLAINGSVNAVAPNGTGGWYIGGSFSKVGATTRNNLAAIDGDGGLLPWNPNANNTVSSLAVSGGAVYVGGAFTTMGDGARNRLAAIDGDGGLLSWNPNAGGNSVTALAVSASTVYVGGDFWAIGVTGRNNLAAIGTDGTLQSWNPNANFPVNALAVLGTTVFVGGGFTTIDGGTRNSLAAIGTDGTLQPWDPNPNGRVNALAVSGTTVYAAGNFTTIAGGARGRVAAFDGNGALLPWNPYPNGDVNALAVSGSTVYAGGDFTTVDGRTRNNLAAIGTDGTLLPWQPTANNPVSSLAVSGSTVYAGGGFTMTNGTTRNYLAAMGTDGTLLPWNPNANGVVMSLAANGTTVYAGGGFTTIDGGTRNRLAAIGTDGTLLPWSPNANSDVNALLVSGSTVYAGGSFTTIDGGTRNRLAAIGTDGVLLPWNPNADNTVEALAVSGSTVYVGGDFWSIGGVLRNSLAAVATGGTLMPWNPSASATVRALAVSGSTVYAGGSFTTIDGGARSKLAAFGTDGTLLPWDPNANDQVRALAARGSTVYAGGSFTYIDAGAGAAARNSIAANGTDGTLLPWNPNVNGVVNTVAVSGSTVYVGGAFTTIGGQHVPYLAPINVTTGVLE
ncbi:MAG: hypothetical protein HYY84_12180 [Deltaproteobacteria bacterium]|nr:hypothetical protein [Deltaproteobacteria bacterium]